jgi:hypothetical protein
MFKRHCSFILPVQINQDAVYALARMVVYPAIPANKVPTCLAKTYGPEVIWQILCMTHPVQLRRNALVSLWSKRAGPSRPTEGSFASLFPTVAMT